MSRPCKKRKVCAKPLYCEFITKNSNSNQIINLTIDEFECLRLLDYEKMTQAECAKKMNVARTTVTSIYQDARYKLMDALINGKKIIISGGNYEVCSENKRKENIEMRIAITYENGNVFEHFGKSKQFKIYDIMNNNISNSFVLDTNGVGHGALKELLSNNEVDVVICGGIGNGAITALESYNIKVYAGANGNCDEIINMFINNELDLNNTSNCDHHHEEEHDCNCGNEKHHHEHNHNCKCNG